MRSDQIPTGSNQFDGINAHSFGSELALVRGLESRTLRVAMEILDHVREAADLVRKLDDIDLYGKISRLEGEIIVLIGEKRAADARIGELTSAATLQQAMKFQKPFYYRAEDAQPFCATCWEVNNRAVHLAGPLCQGDQKIFECAECQRAYIIYPDGNSFVTK